MQMATTTHAFAARRGFMLRRFKPEFIHPDAIIFEHADDWLLDEQPYAIIPGFSERAEEDILVRHAAHKVKRF